IPDHTAAIDKTLLKLDTLISSVDKLASPTPSDYSEYLLMLDTRLEQLNYNLFGDDILPPASAFSAYAADAASGGVGFDDRIVDSLKRISTVLGNHNVPNSISSDLYDIKLDQEHIFDQLIAYFPKFLEALDKSADTDPYFREDDDDNSLNTLIDTLTPIINNVVNSVYIGQLLSFTDEVTNGISFTNGIVTGIYESLGPSFSKAVLLGAGFTLIAVVIRKERAA
ncbi:MAG: hypothetical protein NC223_11580, partial [Butyrivibrio sp.]|nr:hypothetical protein [Butyrivibrio sp.]